MQIQQQGCFACRTEEKCNQIRNSPFLLLAPTTLDAQLFSIDDVVVIRFPFHTVSTTTTPGVWCKAFTQPHTYINVCSRLSISSKTAFAHGSKHLGFNNRHIPPSSHLTSAAAAGVPTRFNPIQTAIALRMQMQTFLYAKQCPSRLAPTDRPTGSEVHARGD